MVITLSNWFDSPNPGQQQKKPSNIIYSRYLHLKSLHLKWRILMNLVPAWVGIQKFHERQPTNKQVSKNNRSKEFSGRKTLGLPWLFRLVAASFVLHPEINLTKATRLSMIVFFFVFAGVCPLSSRLDMVKYPNKNATTSYNIHVKPVFHLETFTQ